MSSTDTNCITDLGEDAAPILAAESVAGSRREVWLEPQAYIRQIHTHTHMRSVLVLSFRLLWTLSWEITLNKIRPGESRRHVGIVSGGEGFISSLRSIRGSISPPSVRCPYKHPHVLKDYQDPVFSGASS